MNPVSLSDSVYLHFGTSSSTTGAATNADSTPTVVVAEDGTDMAYAPTVTNVTTGLYKVQLDCTAGNGFEAGRRYSVYAVATVGGITGRDGIGEFEVLAVDLNTGVASVTGAVGSVTGAVGSVTAAVTVGTINANVVNASALAADAVTEIQSGLALSTQVDALEGDTTTLLGRLTAIRAGNLDNLDATVSSRLAAAAYTAPLDAAGTRAALGLAAANLDTQLAALPTATEISTDMLDTVIDAAYTLRQLLRLYGSAMGGKASGLDTTTAIYRSLADDKDRITATVDANGNRTAVTLDLT
jgi:hypothetical protein